MLFEPLRCNPPLLASAIDVGSSSSSISPSSIPNNGILHDARRLRRQRGMKHREFGLYDSSPTAPTPTPTPTPHPASDPDTDADPSTWRSTTSKRWATVGASDIQAEAKSDFPADFSLKPGSKKDGRGTRSGVVIGDDALELLPPAKIRDRDDGISTRIDSLRGQHVGPHGNRFGHVGNEPGKQLGSHGDTSPRFIQVRGRDDTDTTKTRVPSSSSARHRPRKPDYYYDDDIPPLWTDTTVQQEQDDGNIQTKWNNLEGKGEIQVESTATRKPTTGPSVCKFQPTHSSTVSDSPPQLALVVPASPGWGDSFANIGNLNLSFHSLGKHSSLNLAVNEAAERVIRGCRPPSSPLTPASPPLGPLESHRVIRTSSTSSTASTSNTGHTGTGSAAGEISGTPDANKACTDDAETPKSNSPTRYSTNCSDFSPSGSAFPTAVSPAVSVPGPAGPVPGHQRERIRFVQRPGTPPLKFSAPVSTRSALVPGSKQLELLPPFQLAVTADHPIIQKTACRKPTTTSTSSTDICITTYPTFPTRTTSIPPVPSVPSSIPSTPTGESPKKRRGPCAALVGNSPVFILNSNSNNTDDTTLETPTTSATTSSSTPRRRRPDDAKKASPASTPTKSPRTARRRHIPAHAHAHGREEITIMPVGNFSRPTRPSVTQQDSNTTFSGPRTEPATAAANNTSYEGNGITAAARNSPYDGWPLPRSPTYGRLPDPSAEEGLFNFSRPAPGRGRGASVSSLRTASTINPNNPNNFSSATIILPPPPHSATEPYFDSRARNWTVPVPTITAASAAGPPPPPIIHKPTPMYGRAFENRDPIPWIKGVESRSSFRSLNTASSTTHATSSTERSSLVTKGSSIASMYTGPEDEPSVEDVMVLYEKGFDDSDTELDPQEHEGRRHVEDVLGESRPGTAESDYSLRTAAVPPVVNNPRRIPSPTSPLLSPSSPAIPRDPREEEDALPIFEPTPISSSVPEDDVMNRPARTSSKDANLPRSMSDREEQTARAPPPPPLDTTLQAPIEVLPDSLPVEEDPDSRDRYGFKKANQYITREQYDEWSEGYSEYIDRRRSKWLAYMKESGLSTDKPNRFPQPGVKTKRFIRKGIPPEWRGAAWFYYAKGPAILGRHAGLYDKLVRQKAKDSDADLIERDLHRTFPDNVRFRPPGTSIASMATSGRWTPGEPSTPVEGEPEIISSLRRVLHAFSIYNPKIGYCQSLNFIAGLLLLFVASEEQCFWLLNVITRSLLPGTHETNLEGSKVDLGVLMTVLHDSMPELWYKLAGDDIGASHTTPATAATRPATAKASRRPRVRRKDVVAASSERLPPITITMAAWFMSCFIGTLPIETTLRVWDVFFYEGSKTMFRVALAILKVGEDEVMAVEDPMEMFGVVQGMPRRMLDANQLLGACFKRRNGFGHVSQGTVDAERKGLRERAEKERRKGEGEEVEERKRNIFGRRK